MLKNLLNLFKKYNLYEEAHDDACKMLNRANNMFDNASAKLRGKTIPHPDVDIFHEERKVDKTERSVRKKVLIHLSVSGVTDAPSAIILLSNVIDIERVGDYTTNILELAESVNNTLHLSKFEDELSQTEKQIEDLFDVVSQAFEYSDKEKAEPVVNKELTGRCEKLLHKIISDDVGLETHNAVVAALYVRYLKRVSAHLLNIATSLVQPFEKVHFIPKSATSDYEKREEE